ncbi:TIGR00375 family protein [Bacillus sp. HMF5848]|uniref:endonuclease Q family protein n=1 Tax=Bacillus sp. HMF5848 TaxID=2495421 RepID=UPI000F7A2874|nr:endonuclease Q family protein [Bacillus sp. HMF5848]RSK26802.1 TIGR00375 family protein [Bacillus sp. HMF5848]
MNTYYADLHIHIGRTESGKPVKITASKDLTIENILLTASEEKGIDIIGVIDCHVPEVISHLKTLLTNGNCYEDTAGGIHFKNTTLLLGSELEINDQTSLGPIHVLVFFPFLSNMEKFSSWLSHHVTNVTLSSQRVYTTGRELQNVVKELNGLFIPAHVFTPFKSLYGSGVNYTLKEVFDPNMIDAIELGLSSNTKMADQIAELHPYTFLSNSDAHSLKKIGREYQTIALKNPTFFEFQQALKQQNGRIILKNYGLDPLLGKYHKTACRQCQTVWMPNTTSCTKCGSEKTVTGVEDRIRQLATTSTSINRPPYVHQVPLQFIPGIGPKTLEKLKSHFKTEMAVLHKATEEQLLTVLPEKIVRYIMMARNGELSLKSGGGGLFGKVDTK